MSKDSIIEIDACKKSVKYREKLFSLFDNKNKTEEQRKESAGKIYDSLKDREDKQDFPKIRTKNKLKKENDMGEVYSLSKNSFENIILFIHGGAFIFGIIDTHVKFCDELVEKMNAKVYMPLYPLAPQHDYKDVYNMVEDVYDELLKQDKRIIVMGDSAGGTISLGLTLRLMEKGKKLPYKVIPISPCVDGTFTNENIKEFAEKDGMLSLEDSLVYSQLFAGGDDVKTALVSPIFAKYDGFPDTLLFAATCDLLGADDLELYEKMKNSGVNVTLVKGNGFWHVFPIYKIKEQDYLIKIIKDFCDIT